MPGLPRSARTNRAHERLGISRSRYRGSAPDARTDSRRRRQGCIARAVDELIAYEVEPAVVRKLRRDNWQVRSRGPFATSAPTDHVALLAITPEQPLMGHLEAAAARADAGGRSAGARVPRRLQLQPQGSVLRSTRAAAAPSSAHSRSRGCPLNQPATSPVPAATAGRNLSAHRDGLSGYQSIAG